MQRLLLYSLAIFIGINVNAQPGDNFSVLQQTPPGKRLPLARKIYNDRISRLDSAGALASLGRLMQWAGEEEDVSLKIFSLVAAGDYYRQYYAQQEYLAVRQYTAALAIVQQLKEPGTEYFNLLQKQNSIELLLISCLAKAKLFGLQKRYDSAAAYFDAAMNIQANLYSPMNDRPATLVQQEAAADQPLSADRMLNDEKDRAPAAGNLIIITGSLLLVIAGLFMYRLRVQGRNNRKQLQNLHNRLEEHEKSLQKKDQLIGQLNNEIMQLHLLRDNYSRQKEKEEIIDKLKHYTILTEEQWIEFKRLFEKIQQGFFERLQEKLPELTPAEKRLMVLLKLNLSRSEMADMLGVSSEAIKKTRQRIRKKISMPENMDLEELVAKL